MQREQEAPRWNRRGRLTDWLLTAPLLNSFSPYVPLKFVGEFDGMESGASGALNLPSPNASKSELAYELLRATKLELIVLRNCVAEASTLVCAMDEDSALSSDYTLTESGVNYLVDRFRPNWGVFVDAHSLSIDESFAEVVAADVSVGKLFLKIYAECPYTQFHFLDLDSATVNIVEPWSPYPFPVPVGPGYRIRCPVLFTLDNPYTKKLEGYYQNLCSRMPCWLSRTGDTRTDD